MFLNLFYLLFQIYPYLSIAKYQIKSANKDDEDSTAKILICNVYQYNRSFNKLNGIIQNESADILILIETDKWWEKQCTINFGDLYPHHSLKAKDNTYGILLFSKLKLTKTKVNYLINKEVPSISTDVELVNGKQFKLIALHPEPPVPSHSLYSTDRDAELLVVGKKVAEYNMPIVVAGDLNDVAWSYTTSLFQKISGLLDPRRGRGLHSTFHANYPLFRWPLDHIFCSAHFRLIEMRRLRSIDSDHFPILVKLELGTIEKTVNIPQATTKEKNIAKEKIQVAKD